jgi:AraC family transcriptional regulator
MPMAGRRLEEVFDGRRRPVCEAPPLLCSTQTPWAGFLLERDACREGSATSLLYPHTSLVLVTSGSIAVTDRALRGEKHFVAAEGTVTLWPAGYESRSISWAPERTGAAAEMLRVQLDQSVLARLAPEDHCIAEQPLVQRSAIDDQAVQGMLRIMETEVSTGCPAGRLFGESISLALATHLARRHARGAVKPCSVSGGLSHAQCERVHDYVLDHLDGDTSLAELATVTGLSPRHFAVAFRRTVGMTPHQYVLRTRIQEAKNLLATHRLAIAEIAVSLGFASQSHFTEVFRRVVGTTPARYRHGH